uniref:HAT C-terminal dimerisation domain-containing protein n=1 Tax=Globodera rostochiensis TaxID=31243 RepID=A0A914H8I1_GLORO
MTQHLIHNQQKLPRAKSLRSNKILRISMIVDPRFAFDENILLKDEWIEVENELIDFYRNAAEVSDDLMIETSWTSLAIKTRAMRKNVELANFQSIEKPDPNECDPFAFWKIYSTKFPTLTKAAQALLAIPATSVSSERLFSKAG